MKRLLFSTLIIALFVILMVMQGCVRTRTDIENEKCDEYREMYAQVSCYKYKAAYLAAMGEKEEAKKTCEEMKTKLGGSCLSWSTLTNPKKLFIGDVYSDCISKVAYYSEDENICYDIELGCEDKALQLLSIIFKKAVSPITPAVPTLQLHEIEKCKVKVETKRELGSEILDNFKYIGFNP